MYYFEDSVAQATADAGLRGVLGQSVLKFPAPDTAQPALLPRVLQAVARGLHQEGPAALARAVPRHRVLRQPGPHRGARPGLLHRGQEPHLEPPRRRAQSRAGPPAHRLPGRGRRGGGGLCGDRGWGVMPGGVFQFLGNGCTWLDSRL
ncbi:MAG: hypothetical protein FJ011_24805 [Chloroflexi bacterium]|nr:hypothetical protein [Chloroflexota bacterium]